jgi:hypothetical protein
MLDSIRNRAVEGPPVLGAPEVRLMEKSPHAYRPIAIYTIPDRIIIGQTARYLGARLDNLLVPNSYSQRMGFQTKHRTHHDAVEALLSYRERHGTEQLWLAECDLLGFFDCVSHDVARQKLQQAVHASGERGVKIDSRALALVDAYLNSYSFSTVAVPAAKKWLAAHDKAGRLVNHAKQLDKLWGGAPPSGIGLPQGGALSGLLANLVLDAADRAVLQSDGEPDPGLFYARYVDDMVIAHPDRGHCDAAFKRYLATVEQLKLPVHAPAQIRDYDSRFKSTGKTRYWALKSRAPYSWEKKGTTKASVPWVGFLGYQIRFDGLMRIRPSSVAKQLLKQVAEVDAILRVIRPRGTGPNRDVLAERTLQSFVFRLNAVAVGRGKGNHDLRGWSTGFGLLKGRSHVTTQLRSLDRGRGKQQQRLIRWVRAYTGFSPAPALLERLRRASTSYAGQFGAQVQDRSSGARR